MAGLLKLSIMFSVFTLTVGQRGGLRIEAPPGIDVDHFADPTTSAQHNEIKLDKSTEDGGFYQLVQGRSIDIPEHASGTHLEVFCYKGEAKKLQTFFKTVELQLTIKENTFHYYEAENASMVRHMHSQSSWFSFTPWQPSSFRLDLYKKSCVGIETTASYTVSLRARFLDVWRVCLLCGGVLVFSGAPALARNLLFHYLSASCLAVVGSFLIVLILLAKFIPKRSGAVTFMLGGSGLFLYLAQLLYTNFVTLINEYYNIFLGYISCTAVISFCVMYRCGGVSDVRTLQLLQWLLQGGGLLAVYCSSQYREVALAAVLLLLAYHNTPSVLSTTVKSAWRRKFPPKVRLLTEEEFIQQGNVATAKALEDLRNYCRSPDCNAWKTLSRLRSPQSLDRKEPRPYRPCRSRIPRFAEFVEGSSHLLDDEILQYDHSHHNGSPGARVLTLTDDEDDLTDDDER